MVKTGMFQALQLIPFNKKALSAGAIILVTVLFMWISADYVYGSYAETVRNTMTIYFFLFLLPYTAVNMAPKAIKDESIGNFLIGFIGTGALLFVAGSIIQGFSNTAVLSEPFTASITITGLGFGVLHAFVKAYIEESVFRWALPKFVGLGDIISSMLFGVFHLSILMAFTIPAMIATGALVDLGVANYTYAIAPVITLMVLGLIWAMVRNQFGIMGSTGSHTAWNMFALGILPVIFLGGVA